VRSDPANEPEQEHRQVLYEQRERHEERVAGLRRHEQRPGRERHAVADVGDSGRGEEPPEAPAQSAGRDGVGGAWERGRHGAEDIGLSAPGHGPRVERDDAVDEAAPAEDPYRLPRHSQGSTERSHVARAAPDPGSTEARLPTIPAETRAGRGSRTST